MNPPKNQKILLPKIIKSDRITKQSLARYSKAKMSQKSPYWDQMQHLNWVHHVTGIPHIWHQSLGEGIKIALLDSGIEENHPFLSMANLGPSKDFTRKRWRKAKDGHGHGTLCAGIIVGSDPDNRIENARFAGVAPKVQLLIGKVLDEDGVGDLEWLTRGIRWATKQKVDIISISLSVESSNHKLFQAIHEALAKGICIICAAGNYGSQFRSNIGYPARYGGVITIGAHDRYGNPTGFSSKGGEIDFLAPGENIWSTSIGKDIFSEVSGTSYAAPFVAGLAALIMSKHKRYQAFGRPNLTPLQNNEQLREHLMSMAAHTGSHDSHSGYGALTPFRQISGKLPIIPVGIHRNSGLWESRAEADDRADWREFKRESFWKYLLNMPSGQGFLVGKKKKIDEAFILETKNKVMQNARRVVFIYKVKGPDNGMAEIPFFMKPLKTVLKNHLHQLNPFRMPVSQAEWYLDQPCIQGGTGFFISGNKVLTARHNLMDIDEETGDRIRKSLDEILREFRVAVGYALRNDDSVLGFSPERIFSIKNVWMDTTRRPPNARYDWAILEITGVMEGLPNLQLDYSSYSPLEKQVYVLGHPMGLPLKLNYEALVGKQMKNNSSYIMNSDTFPGNSGSPVFDAQSHQLIGLFTGGKPSFQASEGQVSAIIQDITPSECFHFLPEIPDPDFKNFLFSQFPK